jgi:hypothetical protein
MATTDQFLLALQAYQDLKVELKPGGQSGDEGQPSPEHAAPVFSADSVPDGSLLLGLAEDGLPLMFDLYDPAPGPLLAAGDGGSGKTALLQSMARATEIKDPGEIQFGVVTPFPEEWRALEACPGCLGVWPAYHPSADQFMARLIDWADTLSKTRQAVVLFVDGLDLMAGNGFQFQHDLRWLLMYGPERQVWPVVSVNPGRFPRLQTWMEYFQTRLIGHVKQPHNARLLLDEREIDLDSLLPGTQFVLAQPDSWLKFILPPLG